ncbi:MAG: hypothetical protein NTV54_13570 [Ignavibacteriales bacterium]|nr:hypothetical protein [Ignavibacteriales bacterium]
MKKKLGFVVAASLLFCLTATAQLENLSIGFIGSQFGNYHHDQRISEIRNPQGYGVVVGYQLRRDIAIGVTEEFAAGDMERWQGTEKNYRTNISVFLFPIITPYVRPYLSAGVVYTHRHLEYQNTPAENRNIYNGRLGAGLDYPIFSSISVNGDIGLYNDGWRFVGWGGSFGLRYRL